MEAEGKIVQEGWLKQEQGKQENILIRSTSNDSLAQLAAMEEGQMNSIYVESKQQLPTLTRQGRWWEKWITSDIQQQSQQNRNNDIDVDRDSRIEDLEEPENFDKLQASIHAGPSKHQQQVVPASVVHAPGRRLEGDEAIKVQVPLTADTSFQTRQRTIAWKAANRQWELEMAHGILPGNTTNSNRPQRQEQIKQLPLLDGRMFFSAKESYPMQVFSVLRYEPKREEAARRRQKLEERGGGGTQFFILPSRDWRGISYGALLPSKEHHHHKDKGVGIHDDENEKHNAATKKIERNAALLFDRFASKSSDNISVKPTSESEVEDPMVTPKNFVDDTDDETDSDDDDPYVAGLLDDPDMVLGRHRNVMIGDRGTGPIVSSTIQFVKPKLLKAELNKQFRDRFDGYEPPEQQRKFIGARVVDGAYTLIDPTEDNAVGGNEDESTVGTTATSPTNATSVVTPRRKRHGSVSSYSTSNAEGGGAAEGQETIRMPPSLTLSKIRSLKEQALMAAIKAKLEISTVALAIVYFERLCLDCRVDKSNRRLSFAACLLIAVKINEDLKALGKQEEIESSSTNTKKSRPSHRFQSLIRPTKKVDSMFESLLAFFTQDWNISLQQLFMAEWQVFAALQFRLSAKPSHVAFHFRLLMKSLGWDPRRYLGMEMYTNWQKALVEEEIQREEREERRKIRRQRKEEKKLVQLERELEAANRKEKLARSSLNSGSDDNDAKRDKIEVIPLKKDEFDGESPKGRRTKRRGSRHGLGDIFKLPIGMRSHSTERHWKSSHDTLHAKKSPSTPSTPKNDVKVVDVDTKAALSTAVRPLTKSSSMFARTSLEKDLVGADIVVTKDNNEANQGTDDPEDDEKSSDGEGAIVI
ncbi:MAG: hypothetical protein SGILL_002330 [Bacillariaceae sp.]